MVGGAKAQLKAAQMKGQLKETAGRAVGNERLTAKGRVEQFRCAVLNAARKARSAFRR